MELEVAEMALHDEDPGLDLGVLQDHVGERLDVKPRRDLDHARGHPCAGQPPADPGAQVAHGLRLQLIDEDRGTQLRHQRDTTSRSSSMISRRISSRVIASWEAVAPTGSREAVATWRGAGGVAAHGSSPSKSPNGSLGSFA